MVVKCANFTLEAQTSGGKSHAEPSLHRLGQTCDLMLQERLAVDTASQKLVHAWGYIRMLTDVHVCGWKPSLHTIGFTTSVETLPLLLSSIEGWPGVW